MTSPAAHSPLAVLLTRPGLWSLEPWLFCCLAVSFIIGSLLDGCFPARPILRPPCRQPTRSRTNPQNPLPRPNPRDKNQPAAPASDELVVYEKGEVVFRMKPVPTKPDRRSISRPIPLPPGNPEMRS